MAVVSLQTVVTSMDRLCQGESKTLWPSNNDDMPDLPFVGSSFTNGVKFSVQMGSFAKAARIRYRLLSSANKGRPFSSLSGWKEETGYVVLELSTKLIEAQNSPLREFANFFH